MSFDNSPIFWAQFGRASWKLAKLFPTPQPPVLVMSNPRSGSSWVGEMLGSADNALYLREPLTQTTMDFGVPWEQVPLDPLKIPIAYQRCADAAFRALPIFHPRIVAFPKQWRLLDRRRRKLVIKEVNLAAFDLLADQYRPKLILLVRHPASVALSYQRLKWLATDSPAIQRHGHKQAALLRKVWDRLQSYPEHQVVLYEDLCADPIKYFQALYSFGGLAWNERAEHTVRQHSEQGDRSDTYGTYRNSQSLIYDWRESMSADGLQALREAYTHYDLPWYRTEADW